VYARRVATKLLDDEALERVCEVVPRGPKPDYRSGRHAVEVKRLTSPSAASFRTARDRFLPEAVQPVTGLQHLWLVFLDISEAHASFRGGIPTPQAKVLVKELGSLLRAFETDGIMDAGGRPEVHRLTGGYTCAAVPVSPNGTPGIMFSTAVGTRRTTNIDLDVVEFLQDWLDSPESTNLRESLAGEPLWRVAVLIADSGGPASGMLRTLMDTTDGPVVPKAELRLPPEIGSLILVAGNDVLDFGLADGWRRRSATSLVPFGTEPGG
jgi:hypothetical protein